MDALFPRMGLILQIINISASSVDFLMRQIAHVQCVHDTHPWIDDDDATLCLVQSPLLLVINIGYKLACAQYTYMIITMGAPQLQLVKLSALRQFL